MTFEYKANPVVLSDNPSREDKQKYLGVRILEEARITFLKKGYMATTVNEIAQRAEITKRTLYKYFPSKMAIYVEIFDLYLANYHSALQKTANLEMSTHEILSRLLETQYLFVKDNEKFMRLFWVMNPEEYGGKVPDELVSSVQKWSYANFELILPLIERGIEKGRYLSGISAEDIVHITTSIIKGIFIHTNRELKFHKVRTSSDRVFKNLMVVLTEGLIKKRGVDPIGRS
ncbi:MAG: TetR/AcrR family transcriptional regulator [Deltaproteobacteria bacterium]|nr:TetR/AcrR family transcriptional regulator [Deltaproteobacteria bacterium]